jgi:hypothetical protein
MKRDHHSTDGMFGLEHPIVLALMGTVSAGRLAAAVCRTPAGWGPSAWDSVARRPGRILFSCDVSLRRSLGVPRTAFNVERAHRRGATDVVEVHRKNPDARKSVRMAAC